jgi:putative phage-type endonuclease
MTGKPLSKEAWLAERRNFIGGSEAALVCGVSPWGNKFDVWLYKVEGVVNEQSEPAYWGHKHERGLLERLQEDHPEWQVVPLQHEIYRHRDYSFMGCTPDGYIKDGDTMVLIEAKSTAITQADRWGEELTDQVPDEVLVQCLHNMIVIGTAIVVCYVPLLIGGNQYRLYKVERSENTKATEEKIIAAEREFWETYVVPKVQPEMGDSPAAADYLKRKFPGGDNGDPDVANDEETAAIQELRDRFVVSEQAKSRYTAQVNEVKSKIGDRSGLVSTAGKVTWCRTKDSEKTDWKAAAYQIKHLVPDTAWNTAIAEQTETKPGYRVFNKPRNWGKE